MNLTGSNTRSMPEQLWGMLLVFVRLLCNVCGDGHESEAPVGGVGFGILRPTLTEDLGTPSGFAFR